MKKYLVICAVIILILVSCTKPKEEPGVVKIETSDSLLFLNGEKIGHLGMESGLFQFTIPALAKKLDSVSEVVYALEDSLNTEIDRKCMLTMRDEQPYIDMVKIVATCFGNRFTFVQLVPLNQLTSSDLVICQPEHPLGLTHQIYLTPSGIWITVPYEQCFLKPVDRPKGRNIIVASAKKAANSHPNVAAKFIPLQDSKYDWSRFEAEMELITTQLVKFGYTFGRHFTLAADAGMSCGEIRKAGRIIQKTIPNLNMQAVSKASIIDIGFPAFRGRIPLPNNQFISADSFSVSIGLIADSNVQESYFTVKDTTRFSLLGLDNLLVSALRNKDHELLKSLLGFDVDVNAYPALYFPDDENWRGYTPLMMAIEMSDTTSIRLLMNQGADTKKPSRQYEQKSTAWVKATAGTHTPVFKGMITTPLRLAKEIKNQDVIRLITEMMKK